MRNTLIGLYLGCIGLNVFDDVLVGDVRPKTYLGTTIAFLLLAGLDAAGVHQIAIPLGYLVTLAVAFWYLPGILATLV